MSYILLHGLGQTSSSWNETIQTLNEDRNIFCPDLSDWIMGKQPCYDTLYKAFEKYCEQFDDTLCLSAHSDRDIFGIGFKALLAIF